MAEVQKKVLVIDDDKDIHPLLRVVFGKDGYQVFSALDAMQGMMMAKQLKPDLIVLDIMMPAGGGYAVYERMQMMAGAFQVPFLIYSSIEPAVIMKKIQIGPQAEVLRKPATVDALREAARRLTGN